MAPVVGSILQSAASQLLGKLINPESTRPGR